MIFVTVGTELAFDRLVQPIDEWAQREKRTDVFAQIGPSSWRPRHIEWARFLDAPECRRRISAASVVVAHAGMGTILLARELGKPILVMPRRAELKEHRTNHQLATTKELAAQGSVVAVMDEKELVEKLSNLDQLAFARPISGFAPRQLLNVITNFIELGVTSAGTDVSAGGSELKHAAPRRAGLDVSGSALLGTSK